MAEFEIIVKNDKEALRLRLPEEVVERIKTVMSINESEYKELDTEDILKLIIKSLDKLLYGFQYTSPHKEKRLDTQYGTVMTEKSNNDKVRKG